MSTFYFIALLATMSLEMCASYFASVRKERYTLAGFSEVSPMCGKCQTPYNTFRVFLWSIALRHP